VKKFYLARACLLIGFAALVPLRVFFTQRLGGVSVNLKGNTVKRQERILHRRHSFKICAEFYRVTWTFPRLQDEVALSDVPIARSVGTGMDKIRLCSGPF